MTEDEHPAPPAHHDARMRLVLEVAVFQLKIATEAIRDLLLSPISIIAAIVGLLAGGEEPEQYFRRVQRFGRRSDLWLNVFGHRHRGPSADDLVRPLEEKLLAQTRPGGRFTRGAGQVNQLLDTVNRKQSDSEPTDKTS